MEREIRLFSYKMTHDNGFAPNPFHDILTLATCKPQIRKSKKVGDWIAGFTSKTLCDDPVGEEKLVYLMRVTQKLSYREYWSNPKFKVKIPGEDNIIHKTGDNIYDPIGVQTFRQIPNRNHSETEMQHDLNGEYVLISDDFYYFGNSAISLPEVVRPTVPKVQSSQGYSTKDFERAKNFIEYIRSNFKKGLIDYPHGWPRK